VVARLPLRQAGNPAWLFAAAGVLVLQQVAVRGLGPSGGEALLRRGIFLVTTILLIAMALRFRRFAGAWLVALGIALNLPPILAHGGLMPVSYDTVAASGLLPGLDEGDIGTQIHGSKDIILADGDIQLEWLADRFIVSVPGYGANIYSLGDFILFAGVAVAAGEALALITAPGLTGRERPSTPPGGERGRTRRRAAGTNAAG
jgi:hypothetical protein